MKRTILVALVLVFVVTVIGQQLPDNIIQEYKIGPKDLFEIKVQEVPELARLSVRVSEDGSITIPLAGSIKIEGLTKDQVENLIASTLIERKLVLNPHVSVFIREYQSQTVYLIGAVTKPGTCPLVGRLTLLDVISKAGGFKENAWMRSLF